ncbi:helix-turn-helix domain-containing protein [Streptomyces sp. NPDC051555]|uniref:helix-turn-helix domain-containing protein n=1 Tax=Streptomyces sp. NPDC051555 TaxID=3365657 RepID=UPI00378BF4DA
MTQSIETTSELALPSPKERRRLREAAELTHDDVATAVGVTPSTVRSWETGRTAPRGRKREAYVKLLTGADGAEVVEVADGDDSRIPVTGAAGDPVHNSAAGTPGAALRVAGAVRAFTKAGGAARPGAAQTRPKAAAKRAAKPPAGSPGHETRAAAPTGHRSPHPAPTAPARPPTPVPPAPPAPPTAAPAARPDPAPAAAPEQAAEADADPAAPEARDRPEPVPLAPTEAFDALYGYAAPALVRQTYLLTGRRTLARESVERAFHQAWQQWPEVATDPDPVGWVRAAAYEHALSPWHRLGRAHRHPDQPPAEPADRILMDAMLSLPPAHRRTVLLYDGIGLDLPDTAAETEASTPTAGNRLVNAHAELADRLPELVDVAPEKQSALLRERLGSLAPAVSLEPRPAVDVRRTSEHRTRFWTRAVVGLTAAIAAATAYTAVTAPTRYEPVPAPGATVAGVPAPHNGPPRLNDASRELHEKLRSEPAAGPHRLHPKGE